MFAVGFGSRFQQGQVQDAAGAGGTRTGRHGDVLLGHRTSGCGAGRGCGCTRGGRGTARGGRADGVSRLGRDHLGRGSGRGGAKGSRAGRSRGRVRGWGSGVHRGGGGGAGLGGPRGGSDEWGDGGAGASGVPAASGGLLRAVPGPLARAAGGPAGGPGAVARCPAGSLANCPGVGRAAGAPVAVVNRRRRPADLGPAVMAAATRTSGQGQRTGPTPPDAVPPPTWSSSGPVSSWSCGGWHARPRGHRPAIEPARRDGHGRRDGGGHDRWLWARQPRYHQCRPR